MEKVKVQKNTNERERERGGSFSPKSKDIINLYTNQYPLEEVGYYRAIKTANVQQQEPDFFIHIPPHSTIGGEFFRGESNKEIIKNIIESYTENKYFNYPFSSFSKTKDVVVEKFLDRAPILVKIQGQMFGKDISPNSTFKEEKEFILRDNKVKTSNAYVCIKSDLEKNGHYDQIKKLKIEKNDINNLDINKLQKDGLVLVFEVKSYLDKTKMQQHEKIYNRTVRNSATYDNFNKFNQKTKEERASGNEKER